ncbi:MAG: ABC transporter ATP-binding protein [Pirellulales bacterium]
MLLEIRNVSKAYAVRSERVHALGDLSLELDVGDFVAVQGESGCGKTTLLLTAGGLLEPDGGEILIGGQNPYALTADRRAELRARQLGFVFQQFHLVPYLSVLENVLTAAMATQQSESSQRAEANTRALELIDHLGLKHRTEHLPGQLSTGERQRTALARALLNRPQVILADEPTGNLDRTNAALVLEHLQEFSREGAVLLVTHDEQALEYAQRVCKMEAGRLV